MPLLLEHIDGIARQKHNGSMRYPKVFFIYCSLDKAMENAAHDEPGFWDRWAENF